MDNCNRNVIVTMCKGVLWFYSRYKYLMRTKTNAYQILALMNMHSLGVHKGYVWVGVT